MKRKHSRRSHRKHAVIGRTKPAENYLVVVRSWMLVVLFAIMLGVGAVVGTFLNTQLQQSSPEVAGVEIEAQ